MKKRIAILVFVAFVCTSLATELRAKVSRSSRRQVGNPLRQPQQQKPEIKSLHGNNNKHRGKYFSQIGQDALVDSLLRSKNNGVFVESGAYNGVVFSNSLFLEATRGWTGLLIEANPHLYDTIVSSSDRKCDVINACLSPSPRPGTLPFRLAGPIGGLVSQFSNDHVERIDREKRQNEGWLQGAEGSTQDIEIPCWPLDMIVKAWGNRTIDYWSLDTEGSEASILRATDFTKVDIKVLTVEVNDKASEEAVLDAMKDAPYKLHSKVDFDLVFVKNGFDPARSQPFT